MRTTTINILSIIVLSAGVMASSAAMARGYAGTYSGGWHDEGRWNNVYYRDWNRDNYGDTLIDNTSSVCDDNGNCY